MSIRFSYEYNNIVNEFEETADESALEKDSSAIKLQDGM